MIYEYKNNNRDGMNLGNVTVGFMLGVVACLLMTMCSSCTTTKYVTVPEYHTDTVLVNKTVHDSIWVHDSVMVTQYQKGDTIYQECEKWHTKYVLKEVHDTTYISKIDSIPQPYPVEVTKEVPAELSWWQQARMYVGTITLIALLVIIIIYLLRYYLQKHALP
jgi:hypothetical protein